MKNTRLLTRYLIRAIIFAAGFSALGYVSSFLSIGRCESIIAQEIAADIGDRHIFVLSRSSSYVKARVRHAGFVTQECPKNEACFPWAELYAYPTPWPYTVKVTWGYVAAPLAGQGSRTTFLCWFGFVVKLSEKGRWVT
jgi:hypothetical protein